MEDVNSDYLVFLIILIIGDTEQYYQATV